MIRHPLRSTLFPYTTLSRSNRTAVLLAKTGVVAAFAGVIGLGGAFGSVAVSKLIRPSANLAINTEFAWRAVAGVGLVYAFAAVIAVSVGSLVRHSAGAISILLIYTQLVEQLIQLIPKVGVNIQHWMPFYVANRFLTGNPDLTNRPVTEGPTPSASSLPPWAAAAYFAGIAVVFLIVAL